jgi:hypothetical protein
MKRRGWLVGWLVGWFLLAWPSAVMAHSGAPYPVLLEEQVGPYVASALADPDVGTGTFYVLVAMPDKAPAPADTTVTIWSQPEDGHATEAAYRAERQQTRYGERFVAKVPFDTKGPWQIRLTIEGSAGNGETGFPIQVTPKGFQWLTTVACLLPFVVLGVLWLRASRRQRPAQPGQGAKSDQQ